MPLDVESIVNSDGDRKQDCEMMAATRLLPRLRERCPTMLAVIPCDALHAIVADERKVKLSAAGDW